jgi:hypothetical protein
MWMTDSPREHYSRDFRDRSDSPLRRIRKPEIHALRAILGMIFI